jgi:site-specific DNA-methyltransferase (adenine-specific)
MGGPCLEWESSDGSLRLFRGDCVAVMRAMPEASVDAVVTDPPAGIGFMGKEWDDFRRSRDAFVTFLRTVMSECLRLLKPGGHALVWAIPRTAHWTTWAIEDAGFEIRDVVVHLFGNGFPKSLDIGKAIDAALGAERKVVGVKPGVRGADGTGCETCMPGKAVGIKQVGCLVPVTVPATPEAARWDGWGTALRPSAEHWILARRPLDGTVAQNVLRHGVGGINIDACRIPRCDKTPFPVGIKSPDSVLLSSLRKNPRTGDANPSGGWPGNVILSHGQNCKLVGHRAVEDGRETVEVWDCDPECPVRMLNAQTEKSSSTRINWKADSGGTPLAGASRFFYTPKASRAERDDGLDEIEPVSGTTVQGRREGSAGSRHPRAGISPGAIRNIHPTVKPIALMEYFVKLVTPPDGIVLDPFVGSGTTMVACARLGFRCIGIDLDPSYARIAMARARRARELSGTLAATEARPGQQLGLLANAEDDDA